MNFRLRKTVEYGKGVTLIEMLVVVAIMMTLLAMATPLFKSDGTERIPRETARSVSSYLQEARAKAMSTGRPCGVAFIPVQNYPSACVIAQLVETPPLYTGETYNSKVTVSGDGKSPTLKFSDNIPATWGQKGNLIRLGSRGLWYEMTSATACTLQTGDENSPDAQYRPWTNGSWTTTYEIQGVPVAQANGYLQSISMEDPLKVPRGGAIDLYYSGVGSGTFNNAATKPVVIMYSATGDVCQVIQNNTRSVPTDKIYILCGQWDRALTDFEPEDKKRNHQVMDNYYVVIDPASGMTKVEQIVNATGDITSSRTFD